MGNVVKHKNNLLNTDFIYSKWNLHWGPTMLQKPIVFIKWKTHSFTKKDAQSTNGYLRNKRTDTKSMKEDPWNSRENMDYSRKNMELATRKLLPQC